MTGRNRGAESELTGLHLSADEQRREIIRASGHYYFSRDQEFDDLPKAMLVAESVRHFRPGPAIELGYMNGIWTRALLSNGASQVTIVEAAPTHVAQARADFADDPRVTVVESLFEHFAPQERATTVLMTGVIKHVPDDFALVHRAREWVVSGGVTIAATPNSRSFHRRLGTYMGMETSPGQRNARDREVFNQRTYDRYTWRELFLNAGYDVLHEQGVFLKPFSTPQMIALTAGTDGPAILDGLRMMGEELPDYSWYLLLVARPRGD